MQVCQTSPEKRWWSSTVQNAWTCTRPNPPDTTTQTEPISVPASLTCCLWCIQSIGQNVQPTNLCQGQYWEQGVKIHIYTVLKVIEIIKTKELSHTTRRKKNLDIHEHEVQNFLNHKSSKPRVFNNFLLSFRLYGFKIHPMAYQLQLQAASSFKSPVKTIR